jgi:GGDEF domain-containing protein
MIEEEKTIEAAPEITEEERQKFFETLRELRKRELERTPAEQREREREKFEKNLELLSSQDRQDIQEEEERLTEAGLNREAARENSVRRLQDKIEGFYDKRFEMLNKVGMRRALGREIRGLLMEKEQITEEDLDNVVVLRGDLNNLKFANDYGGHDTGGDFMLSETARVLKSGKTVENLKGDGRVKEFLPAHESGDEYGAVLVLKENMESEELDKVMNGVRSDIEKIDVSKIPFRLPDSMKRSSNYTEGEENFVASMGMGKVSLKDVAPILIKEAGRFKSIDEFVETAINRMFEEADTRAQENKARIKREWAESPERAKRFTAELGRPEITKGELDRFQAELTAAKQTKEALEKRLREMEKQMEEMTRRKLE